MGGESENLEIFSARAPTNMCSLNYPKDMSIKRELNEKQFERIREEKLQCDECE